MVGLFCCFKLSGGMLRRGLEFGLVAYTRSERYADVTIHPLEHVGRDVGSVCEIEIT